MHVAVVRLIPDFCTLTYFNLIAHIYHYQAYMFLADGINTKIATCRVIYLATSKKHVAGRKEYGQCIRVTPMNSCPHKPKIDKLCHRAIYMIRITLDFMRSLALADGKPLLNKSPCY